MFDRATAERFRRAILSVGGSRDALDAFIDFRGRPPLLDALLRQSGIALATRRSEGRDVERQQPEGSAGTRARVARARAAGRARAARDEDSATITSPSTRFASAATPPCSAARPLQRRRDRFANAGATRSRTASAAVTSTTQKRVLGATFGALRVWNLYVPNGQTRGLRQVRLQARLAHGAARPARGGARRGIRGCWSSATSTSRPKIATSTIPVAWAGQVLCTPAERAALAAIAELGLRDTFRLFDQPPGTYSWWDYRAGMFRRNKGLRIDLMLASRSLSKVCSACRIDREPRGWDRPSDHVPVVAEFDRG